MKRFLEDAGAVAIIAAVLAALYLVYHPLLVTFFGTKF